VFPAKKIALFAATFTLTCALLTLPAAAQWGGGEYRPRISTAEEVAITQHVLSADAPSATEWARHTKEYQEANDFDREAVLEDRRRAYIEKFTLFSKPETLVIGANIQLSSYSEVNKGFIIESFNDQTFFSYKFAGQDYAIVVPKLMDYQWMATDPETAKKITSSRVGSRGTVRMVMEVDPKYADKNPIELQGKSYRLLAGEVASISIYGPRSDVVLWSRNSPGRTQKVRGDMIKLYGGNE